MWSNESAKFPVPFQIGLLVKDIEKTIEFYRDIFGIGPWKVIEVDRKDILVRGKKTSYKARIAFAKSGPVEIELTQILSGTGLCSEFLEQGREGLHHLGFLVTEEQKKQLLMNLAEKGIGVTEGARTVMHPGSYAFLDSDKVGGVIFELIQRPQE
jgi:methylmalonyl-CoA/ethylmalonyl-CoA epimerase